MTEVTTLIWCNKALPYIETVILEMFMLENKIKPKLNLNLLLVFFPVTLFQGVIIILSVCIWRSHTSTVITVNADLRYIYKPPKVIHGQTQHSVHFSGNIPSLSVPPSRVLVAATRQASSLCSGFLQNQQHCRSLSCSTVPQGLHVWQLVPMLRPALTICPGQEVNIASGTTLSLYLELSWTCISITVQYWVWLQQ